jgi:hypothetical protein
MGQRLATVVALLALAPGCFGYNSSAKKWAYAGDTVLILGGGGVIAADQLTKGKPDMGLTMTAAKPYDPPFSGALLAGAVLVTAGILGIIINATRPTVKTSR